MDTDQQFNSLFERYIFSVANEVVSEATPVQQKALIDLLLSVEEPASVGKPTPDSSPVEAAVELKTSQKRFRRPLARKQTTECQHRRGILQLSIEQNQRQITHAIAYISLLDKLILQAENTLLNDNAKRSVVASYQRVMKIYNGQLNRLKDTNHALSHSVSQLA